MTSAQGHKANFSGRSVSHCVSQALDYYNETAPKGIDNGAGGLYSVQANIASCTHTCRINQVTTTTHPTEGVTSSITQFYLGATKSDDTYVCPPDDDGLGSIDYKIGPLKVNNVYSCFKPNKTISVSAIDETWLQRKQEENKVNQGRERVS